MTMTDSQRPNFTTSNDNNLCTSSDVDMINWTYPTHYRATGPKQPIPRGAHTPSSSIGSNITCSSNTHSHSRSRSDFSATKGIDCPKASAVVARILEKDQATGTTYLAGCIAKEKEKSKPYPPPRVESRRALLSMANGTKAPILLRGPSTSSRIAIEGKRGQVVRVPPVPNNSSTTTATRYINKELPPTPPSSTTSSAQDMSASSENGSRAETKSPGGTTIPQTKPLNLALSAANNVSSLAAKRLTRARARQNGGSLALTRFRAVPAPIRLPKLNGPSAFNGPSSAHTSDDEDHIPEGDIEELALGSPLLPRGDEEKGKKMTTPMGDLPITPLDIPVDWDDLQDRWTSPILVHSETEGKGDSKAALEAFRQDVNDLFAPSPSIDVRGSVEAGDYLFYRGQQESTVEEVSEDSDGMKKEKRHGKVMVKKELKLCLDLDMNKRKKSRRGYKKGESFLMMNSPLSPETASLHASMVF